MASIVLKHDNSVENKPNIEQVRTFYFETNRTFVIQIQQEYLTYFN